MLLREASWNFLGEQLAFYGNFDFRENFWTINFFSHLFHAWFSVKEIPIRLVFQNGVVLKQRKKKVFFLSFLIPKRKENTWNFINWAFYCLKRSFELIINIFEWRKDESSLSPANICWYWRRLQDVFKTCLEDVFNTSSA